MQCSSAKKKKKNPVGGFLIQQPPTEFSSPGRFPHAVCSSPLWLLLYLWLPLIQTLAPPTEASFRDLLEDFS